MDFDRIIAKIQKKQLLLLKLLASGAVDMDQDGRLARIATGLRRMGLVKSDVLALTSSGEKLISIFGADLFRSVKMEGADILDKLLQRKKLSTLPKIKKIERLFLAFLSDGAVKLSNIRGATKLIPHFERLGYLVVSDEVELTGPGRDALGENLSEELKDKARKRFFTSVRADGRKDLENRAERYLSLYRNGFTYQEIGDLHGLTRERVRQILNVTPNFAAYLQEHEEAERQRDSQMAFENRLKRLERSLANQFHKQVDALWDHEKNHGLDPTRIASRSASVEIWWKCPIDGHSWKKRPCDIATSWIRSGTSGCPKCAGKSKKPVKQGKLIIAYPEFVSKYWDSEKNKAMGIDELEVTLGSNRSAWFRCPRDSHSWRSAINAIVEQQWSRGNSGCRVCSGTIRRKKGVWKKAPTVSKAFPEQVRSYWDFDRNDPIGLDPAKVTVGSSKEAWFKCPDGEHIWSARIVAIRVSWRNGKSGCPHCHGRRRGKSSRLGDRFPGFLAELWDFETNDAEGLFYERVTTGSNKTVSFRCPKDGTQWMEPVKDIVNYWEKDMSGCPTCFLNRRIRRKVKSF